MTIRSRERITYRIVSRSERAGSFLPTHGVGAGMDESGLGLVLNRVMKGPTRFRSARRTIIGTVIEETKDFVTIQQSDRRQFKISKSNIVQRTVVA